MHFLLRSLAPFHSSRAVGSVSFVPSRVFTTTDATKNAAFARRDRARRRVIVSRVHAFIMHASFMHRAIPSNPIFRARTSRVDVVPRVLRARARFAIRREEGRGRVAATEIKSRLRRPARATWGWKESFQPAIFRDQSRLHIDGYNPMRKDASREAPGDVSYRSCVCARVFTVMGAYVID